MKYNLKTGAEISVKEFPKKEFDELYFFIGNHVFIDNQHEHFLNLVQNDSTNLHILTTQNKIISINTQLNVMHEFERDDAYVHYLRTKNHQFIAKDNTTFIIDHTGKKVAELEISSNAFLVDDILYGKRDKSFIVIDLKSFKFEKLP